MSQLLLSAVECEIDFCKVSSIFTGSELLMYDHPQLYLEICKVQLQEFKIDRLSSCSKEEKKERAQYSISWSDSLLIFNV